MKVRMLGAGILLLAALVASVAGTSSANTTTASVAVADSALTSGVRGLPALPANAAAATAFVNKLQQRPNRIFWNTPLKKPVPKGKSIDFIQCGVPGCVNVGDWMAKTAKVIGWKVKRINGGLTAQSIQAGFQQAIRDKPSAVWIAGFPRVIYESQIQTLKKMKIPVIANATGDKPGNGEIAVIAGPTFYTRVGGVMAAKVIAATKGKAKTYVVTQPELSVQVNLENGFKQEMKRACPGCKATYVHAQSADIGKQVPTQVVSYLRAHPDTNTLLIGYTDLGTGVVAALRAAGLLNKVQIVTQDNNPQTSTDIKNGVPITLFSPATPENVAQGIDVLIRYFSNDATWKQAAQAPVPEWLMNKANLVAAATKSFIPSVANYQAQYNKLWHVKG